MLPEDISDYVNKETRIDSYDKKQNIINSKELMMNIRIFIAK